MKTALQAGKIAARRMNKYAADVIAGRIPAGPHLLNGMRRHQRDWRNAKKRGLYFDYEDAGRAVQWFEELLIMRDDQGNARNFKLFEWQCFLVANTFGWKRPDGTRRFRRVYLETSKGSGKSPLASGIGLKMAFGDGKHLSEVYIIARTADQARVTFRHAENLVIDTEILSNRLKLTGGINCWNISDRTTSSFMRRLANSPEGKGQSGPKAHCVIADELHEWDNSQMLDLYAASTKSDPQPLTLLTSNAGVSMQSVVGVEHRYAARICAGEETNDSYLGLIYSIDNDDDPMDDESVWIKSNPSLPKLPGYDYIRQQVDQARGMPSKRSIVERLCFSRFVEGESPWIAPEIWRACQIKKATRFRKDRDCYLGLDLSSNTDLTAAAIVWDSGDKMEAEVKVWTQSGDIRRRGERDGVDYEAWAKDGFIEITPGDVIDYDAVVRWLIQTRHKYKVAALAYDPWRISYLKVEFEKRGLQTTVEDHGPGLRLLSHPQGFAQGAAGLAKKDVEMKSALRLWMPRSLDACEKAILAKEIKIVENPLLNAAISGMVIVEDGSGNRRIMKNKSLSRIDPGLALIMAVGCADAHRVDKDVSYEYTDAEMGQILFATGKKL